MSAYGLAHSPSAALCGFAKVPLKLRGKGAKRQGEQKNRGRLVKAKRNRSYKGNVVALFYIIFVFEIFKSIFTTPSD